MAQKLRPGAIGRVGHVMSRSFPLAVPSPWWLAAVFPEEGIARVDLTETDHVADSETSSVASCRIRLGASSSGSQLPLSSAAGGRPSRRVRLR